MAGEIQCDLGPANTGITAYAMVRNASGQVYNTTGAAFETFNASNITDYDIALTEQGATGYFTGTMPAVAAGVYGIAIKQRAGGSPAVSDNSIGGGEIQWNGTAVVTLNDLLRLAEADHEIDTTTTPWEEVVKIRGTSTELLRRKLRDTAGQSVTATSQVIGSAKES